MKPVYKKALAIGAAIVAAELLFYGGFRAWDFYQKKIVFEKETAGLKVADALNKEIIADTEKRNEELTEALVAEQEKNAYFEEQIRQVAGAFSLVEKLAKTDRELLRKYSKVYFLSENYVPARLSPIDSAYLSDKAKEQKILTDVSPFLSKMLEAAGQDGVELRIVSAYRSFYEQESVKSGYKILYGAGANKFSADQGYSEHQLGTTVDLAVPGSKILSLAFEKSDQYAWLVKNAYRFGFTLSYPKDNQYYQFEPWHWRFVGVRLATDLAGDGEHFYDLTQRKIDEYLISIFD